MCGGWGIKNFINAKLWQGLAQGLEETPLANVVASQASFHAPYGGVVPEVASRHHLELLLPVLEEALQQAGCRPADVDALAVTIGPGLAGSLLVGVNLAKALAYAWGRPLVAVNHLEAHIYANWLQPGEPPRLPALCLVVSGGHTELVLMEDHGRYVRLGGTLDDAADGLMRSPTPKALTLPCYNGDGTLVQFRKVHKVLRCLALQLAGEQFLDG